MSSSSPSPSERVLGGLVDRAHQLGLYEARSRYTVEYERMFAEQLEVPVTEYNDTLATRVQEQLLAYRLFGFEFYDTTSVKDLARGAYSRPDVRSVESPVSKLFNALKSENPRRLPPINVGLENGIIATVKLRRAFAENLNERYRNKQGVLSLDFAVSMGREPSGTGDPIDESFDFNLMDLNLNDVNGRLRNEVSGIRNGFSTSMAAIEVTDGTDQALAQLGEATDIESAIKSIKDATAKLDSQVTAKEVVELWNWLIANASDPTLNSSIAMQVADLRDKLVIDTAMPQERPKFYDRHTSGGDYAIVPITVPYLDIAA